MQLYVFDHLMKNLKTILTESDVISATETKEINKAGEVDVELPFKSFNIIETDMLLVHTGTDNRYRAYRVINRTLDNEILYIKANEYAYHLMKCDGIIHDKRPNDMPVKNVLANVILNAHDEGVSGWEVGYVDDDLPNFTGNFYREDRLKCLSKIKDYCKCEFEFIFTITNNKIDKRIIEAYNQVGVDSGKRFEYGDNLLSIVAETDASEVFTRAYGFGQGVESGDGYGRKLDMSGVEWSTVDGKPVDKTDWWDFIVDTRGSNYHDMKLDNETDPSTVFEFNDCKVENPDDPASVMKAKEELTWLTWNALQEVNRPKVQFEANLSFAGELKLGDRVQIVRSDIDVRYTVRVFKEERNLANPALSTVELGDRVAFTTGDMIDKVTNQISNVNNQIQDIETNITFIENNTGNTIFYGKDMPKANKKGDLWYEEIDIAGGKQYKIHIWDGEKWVVSYSPEKINEMLERIEQAERDTQSAIERAEQANQTADKLEQDFENNKVEVDKQIQTVIKDNEENANEIIKITENYKGLQLEVDNLEQETNSKITVLDDLVKSTVRQLGVSYPNSEFNDTNLTDFYEVNSELTQIAKDEQGSYLWIKDETSDNGNWPKLNFKADDIRTYWNNVVTIEVEYTLNVENDAGAYVQIVNKDSNDNVVEELPMHLPPSSSKTVKKATLWFNHERAKTQFQTGWNMGANSKIDLRIYNIKLEVVDDNGFNLDFKDPKVERYWHSWDKTTIVKRELDNNVLILRAMPSSGKSIAMLKGFIEVDNKEKLQLNFKSKVNFSWNSNRRCKVYVHEYDENKNEINNKSTYVKYDKSSVWYSNNLEYDLLENTKYIKVEFVHWFTEDSATMYIDSVYLVNGKETVNSSISQLANNINLKVDKNDVVNQINISDEEILIQGNKIHLTGETIIDDAIITSAMIKDLTADKITAGTINGENINIVNIRAENITGVNANLVQTSWNAINGHIEINGDGIFLGKKSDAQYLKLSANRIDFFNGIWDGAHFYSEPGGPCLELSNDATFRIDKWHNGQYFKSADIGEYNVDFWAQNRISLWAKNEIEVNSHMRIFNGFNMRINDTAEKYHFATVNLSGWGIVNAIGNEDFSSYIAFGRGRLFGGANGYYITLVGD